MTLDEILEPYRQEMLRSAETPALPQLGAGPQPYVPDYVAGGDGSWLTSWSLKARQEQLRFVGDALRANNNLITSMVDWVSMTSRLAEADADPQFNVFRDYDLKGLEAYAYQFAEARSREQADIIKDFVVRDMVARKSFSEQGPWTQLLVGAAASLGPADLMPFGALPRSVLGAGLAMGGAMAVQSGLRHSLSPDGGEVGEVAVDAALGALFGSGFRAAQRAISNHGLPFDRWRAAADEADATAAKPTSPEVDVGPISVVDPPPEVVTPRAAAPRDAPFVVTEPGPAGKPMSDHRAQPIHDPEAAPGRPVILYEPVYLQEGSVIDLPGAPRIIAEDGPSGTPSVEAGMYSRPWIITETDRAGEGVARTAPSVHEIVTGQMSDAPLSARGVKLTEGPSPVAASSDEAAEAVKAGRPVVIEDSSAGARGAGAVPTDEASRLATAGGLERLGITPALRLLNSKLATMRETAGALVNHGMLQMGNLFGVAADQSVEARYFALHGARITQTVHGFWEDYAAYAGKQGDSGSRTLDFMLARGAAPASYRDFMQEVTRAVLAGGHENPHVVKAALRFHAATEDLRARANAVGYWDFLYGMREEELTQRIAAAGKDAEKKHRLQLELEDVQRERDQARQRGGPIAESDAGYIPRYWRHDRIMADRTRVESIFDEVIRAKNIRDPLTGKPYTGKEAVDILLNIDPATGAPRPYVKPSGDAWAHSARDRGFSWMPTHLLLDYVETDAEVLFRRYVRQLGMDIELTERFGDPFMMNHIRRLAGEGASAAELNDLMFLRDYLRGTHAPMDPTSLMTHSVQAAKMLANMVVLGGQVITAFTDLARPMMTEGIQRAFGTSLQALGDGMAGLRLWRREADLLGSTGELVQSLRAQAFANGNSAMAGTPSWLQKLERAHSGFFILNGIAPWTETMKTWQSIISTTRVMEHVEALARGEKLSDRAMTKLAAIGIDARNAGDIAAQIEKHGVWLGKTRLPNIAAWDDVEATRVFRTAVWQAVNNSIITPGAANVSRWMVEGTSWLPPQAAQLMSMYHNYGLALHQRLLVAGLQGADANFLSGAMALVALGLAVDHIRDQLNAVGDRQPRYKTFGERLTGAVDRSGLLGYASNINNAIERLSFNTIGVRPFTGQVNWGNGSVVGAMGGLGPVGGWAGNLYRFVNGTAHGREGWAEAQAFRRMLPLQTVFWMDGLFDKVQDAMYVSREERRATARRARDDALAGKILVENGYIERPEEVLDIETYIGAAALKWHRGGRNGSLQEFLIRGDY